MKIGGYVIKVTTELSEKVKEGFNKIFSGIVGASYRPIAYLGDKLVNGTNHAILAEQTLITGKDVKSVVLIVLNEKANEDGPSVFSLVEIKTYLSNGGAMGGVNISPMTDIPESALAEYNKHFAGFLGGYNKPFALLATQVVHGVAYYFAVESTMFINQNEEKSVLGSGGDIASIQIVKVFSDFSEIESTEVITGDKGNLLKTSNTPVMWP